jgi:superfamily II DNA/RNA helicase
VQFDPPNDHKDYLHRSGRTARAGASGMVIALVERGQLRELRRLHDAAGVTAASDEVTAGHHVVRQIAASGTPIPPAPVRPVRDRPASERPASERKGVGRGHSRRRGNGQRSATTATGERTGRPNRTGGTSRTGSADRTGGTSRMVATDRTGSSRVGGGARTGSSRRAARIAASGREDAGRGTDRGTARATARGTARATAQATANPGRRSQSAHRPPRAHGSEYTAKSA